MEASRILVLFIFLSLSLVAQQKADPFEVHEWGTFTSMQSQHGLVLEGLQHEEERLPEFVYSRTEVRECPLRDVGYKGLEVPVTHVTQKMETPVIYFHSKVARKARVRVDFKGGLITQWYPVSNLLGPPEQELGKGPLDLKTVKSSFLEWDIDILPQAAPEPAGVPKVKDDDIWNVARQTGACWLRTHPRKGPNRLGPVEAERYLFYRGLGTFGLPFKIQSSGIHHGSFKNQSQYRVPFAVSVQIRGKYATMSVSHGIEPGKEFKFDFGSKKYMSVKNLVPALEKVICGAAQAEGMTQKEAKAMVQTWARQWFRTEGDRVLYFVPRKMIDTILPLQISPKPAKLERVLVGRLEYIRADKIKRGAVALLGYNSKYTEERKEARAYLHGLDRFLEPHVRLIMKRLKNDKVIQANGAAILAKLKAKK